MGGIFQSDAQRRAREVVPPPGRANESPGSKKLSTFCVISKQAVGTVAIGADGRDPVHLPEYGNSRASMARGRQQVRQRRRDL